MSEGNRFVIRWGDLWQFETVPAAKADIRDGEETYVTKEAALNAALDRLCNEMATLKEAIRKGRKKQRNLDRRREIRDA